VHKPLTIGNIALSDLKAEVARREAAQLEELIAKLDEAPKDVVMVAISGCKHDISIHSRR